MKELIEKIRKKGYWNVEIRPTVFEEKRIPDLDSCIALIKECQVSLRGWSYPHIDNTGISVGGNDSVQSFCDWPEGGYFEYWRLYQSAQFVHYFTMREDYRLSEKKIQEIKHYHSTSSAKFLDIISTLYSVTEVLEFTKRMAINNVFNASVEIKIELGDVQGRELFFWDSFSRYLSRSYVCSFPDENIIASRTIERNDLLANSSKLAIDVCLEIFRKFNWSTNAQIFEEDQRKFLERRS